MLDKGELRTADNVMRFAAIFLFLCSVLIIGAFVHSIGWMFLFPAVVLWMFGGSIVFAIGVRYEIMKDIAELDDEKLKELMADLPPPYSPSSPNGEGQKQASFKADFGLAARQESHVRQILSRTSR